MQQMMLRAEPSEVYNEGLRELSSDILRTNASMSCVANHNEQYSQGRVQLIQKSSKGVYYRLLDVAPFYNDVTE